MGWTGLYYKPPSIPKYFEEQWTRPREDGSHLECLGQAFVGRFTLYGVWRYVGGESDGTTFATVTLIRYGGRGDRCQWYYKDMDETVGPCESSMPKTLLKKLTTPAYNDWARAWRKRCWQNALGLTYRSRLTLIRRYWRRNKAKAKELADEWNNLHPDERLNIRI